MKVLILGAGRVGGSLATALVNNNYDVYFFLEEPTQNFYHKLNY